MTPSPWGEGTTIELVDAGLKGLLSPALSSNPDFLGTGIGEGDRTANSFDKSPNLRAVRGEGERTK